jgi:hypothetical protein
MPDMAEEPARIMNKPLLLLALLSASLAGCATVHPEDTEAWVGQSTNILEKQPYFLTMPVVKTQAADGTEIWNYVIGTQVSSCNQMGTMFGPRLSWGMYSGFMDCTAQYQTCNNIFYINGGKVQRVVVLGTRGAACSTDRRFLPSFTG